MNIEINIPHVHDQLIVRRKEFIHAQINDGTKGDNLREELNCLFGTGRFSSKVYTADGSL